MGPSEAYLEMCLTTTLTRKRIFPRLSTKVRSINRLFQDLSTVSSVVVGGDSLGIFVWKTANTVTVVVEQLAFTNNNRTPTNFTVQNPTTLDGTAKRSLN